MHATPAIAPIPNRRPPCEHAIKNGTAFRTVPLGEAPFDTSSSSASISSCPPSVKASPNSPYVQGILAYGSPIFTRKFLTPLIQEVAAKRGDPKPPSVPTLWRWIRRYQRTGDFRALISRDDLRGVHVPQQSARLLALAEEAITEAHQLSRRTTVTVIQTILQGKVDQENLSRHNGPGLLIMPSPS